MYLLLFKIITLNLHAAKLMDLIYWREMEKTGIVFTGLVIGLLCMFQYSTISVVSNFCLTVMCFTFPVRLLFKALELLHFRNVVHPFNSYLEYDLSLTDEQTVRHVETIVLMAATAITEMKHLLFVGSIYDSIKFIVLMYLLTYVGVRCNGLTLMIAGVISVFSLPLFYRQHQEKIDKLVTKFRTSVNKIKDTFQLLLQNIKSARASAPTSGPKAKPKTK
ncbi:reticulon-2b isoform X2 [Brienomyrus brachyistius]|uniref:reticulon-2b isoform X2 n=1 Tax=Brienomyrus brachyistius TaxID=42636 RepID=UPI0020B37BFA|nr:reticulon-2b isoform X2 [Brienomyrus brachyistius]